MFAFGFGLSYTRSGWPSIRAYWRIGKTLLGAGDRCGRVCARSGASAAELGKPIEVHLRARHLAP